MANSEHIAHLNDGAEKWNQWRRENPSIIPDLHEASLRHLNLREIDFSVAAIDEADLTGSDLTRANLTDANVFETNLSAALLDEANLRDALLVYADLSGASFNRADLAGTDLRGAILREGDLTGANLTGATLGLTTFANVQLRGVNGLGTVIHKEPSSIGIDTIYRSKGDIPDVFLRGCGVPESFIVQMKALIGAMEPVQFYSCFISYSSHDQAFAERLHADLVAKNLRCWFAPEDLKIGERFHERIEESIRVYDKVMIVLSEASVKSRWVEREVTAAREREDRGNRTVLFPVRIDDAVMNARQPWAADIRRSRHIGDFRGWEARSPYVKAFDRLLRDLQVEDATSTERP